MSGIKGGDTSPEIIVRKILHSMGFRFRLHDKKLPGKPDVVLPKHRKVVFVHGCFWHGHPGCKRAKKPASNKEFWQEKLCGNMERDQRNQQKLAELGWGVLIVWSCETAKTDALREKLRRFLDGA